MTNKVEKETRIRIIISHGMDGKRKDLLNIKTESAFTANVAELVQMYVDKYTSERVLDYIFIHGSKETIDYYSRTDLKVYKSYYKSIEKDYGAMISPYGRVYYTEEEKLFFRSTGTDYRYKGSRRDVEVSKLTKGETVKTEWTY